MLRCGKVVKAKKLNLQGCARVHEKTEGQNQCLNDGVEITKARILLLSYDRQIEEGISFRKDLILLCVLCNIGVESRKNFTFRLIFHALPLFQPLYK